jgi:hypothetical protein
MSTEQIISLLVAEKERIERAIAALSGGKGAGAKPAGGQGVRRARTPEQKAAQSEKMKAYWAARRSAETSGGNRGRKK